MSLLCSDPKKALSERLLNAELDEHLVGDSDRSVGNHRNGKSKKTMLTGTSKMTLDIPRDRDGTFDPKLIAKYQRRFPDFDDKVISMYARGMSVREIRMHLEELYGIDVSPDLISAVTSAVLEEVAEWQNRPLDACYPLVFFDAIRVKIGDEGFVRNKAVCQTEPRTFSASGSSNPKVRSSGFASATRTCRWASVGFRDTLSVHEPPAVPAIETGTISRERRPRRCRRLRRAR
jgi:putative transposase